MAVTLKDKREPLETTTTTPAEEVAVFAIPADAVELVATNTFHTAAFGAAHGVTVEPGDRFHTTAPHAEDLKRQGFAAEAPLAEPVEPPAA